MIEPLKDYTPAGLPTTPYWRMAGMAGFSADSKAHIHLLTQPMFDALDRGTFLYSITGERVIVGRDYIDTDTRAGYMAFGKLCIFIDCVKETS